MSALQLQPALDDAGPTVAGEIILVPVADIRIGDRLRAVDQVWAKALGAVMVREGQHTPVEICKLPGQPGWQLVAGAHRVTGARIVGMELVEAREVSPSREYRRLREVSENLWRRELDPFDRAAFVAQLVEHWKLRRGLPTDVDGRAASVTARWLRAAASDTTDTMSVVYGWGKELGEQLGLHERTLRRDLLIYRGIQPSLIEQLRQARHPITGNAAQLRALAKVGPEEQRQIVGLLVHGAKSVSAAQSTLRQRPVADPADKRLSAFIGAFHRMSLAEKKGALAQLAPLLPAGLRLVEGPSAATRIDQGAGDRL